MSPPFTAEAPVDSLLGRLEERDRDGAIELVRALRTLGSTPDELITGVLAPVQRRVGELWQTGSWSISQEHAATSIVDLALADLELTTDVLPVRGDVVVTCAEGEWHALAARMLGAQLRLHGWSVTFLGASIPAAHLARFLDVVDPVAVAVSCSIPIYLLGAQRSLEAAHARGVPALAGGAGFGIDDRRARVLGADGWAPTAAVADEQLGAWAKRRPDLRQPSSTREALSLAAMRDDVVQTALRLAADRFPPMASFDQHQIDRSREDLAFTLQFVEASLLTGDPSVLDDYLPWLERVLAAYGLPREVAPLSTDVLAHALSPGQPEARSLLEQASRRAFGDGGG